MQSTFGQSLALVQLFIDSATRYGQLGTGALVLSVTFLEKIGGEKSGPMRPGGLLIAAWSFLLFSIGCGATYNYFAIKYLEMRAGSLGGSAVDASPLVHSPGLVYGVMLATFWIGAVLLTIGAVLRLRRSPAAVAPQ